MHVREERLKGTNIVHILLCFERHYKHYCTDDHLHRYDPRLAAADGREEFGVNNW